MADSVYDYAGDDSGDYSDDEQRRRGGGGRPYVNDVEAGTTGNTPDASIHSPADLSGGSNVSPGTAKRGGGSVWDYYGVRPPNIQPLPEPDLADRMGFSKGYHLQSSRVQAGNQAEMQRADFELKAAQTADDARRQGRGGTTRDVTVKGDDGKWHLKSIFQPNYGNQPPTTTDIGEAPDPEMRWLNRSQNPEGEALRILTDPKSTPDQKRYAQGVMDNSRRLNLPEPHENKPDRPYPLQPLFDPNGNPTVFDPNKGRFSPGQGYTPPAGGGPLQRPGGPPASRSSANDTSVTRHMDRWEHDHQDATEEEMQAEREKFVRVANPSVAAGRARVGGPVGIEKDNTSPWNPANAFSRTPTGGTQPPAGGNVRPDAMPQQQFVQAFQQKRGRAPTAAELQRATQQGYIR